MSYQQRTQEDERFDEILRLEGMNIQAFHQEQPMDIFPDAKYYPDFFNQNLVNPNRVLKQFLNDPQSNIRIFYFQLLRLAFEIPTQTGFNHICLQNLKKIVFHPEFEILFTPDTESQRQVYNDFQFKKLFAEFISLLISASQSEPPSVEQAIDQFPIIDVILIHIIRSLLVSFNIKVAFDQKIPTDLLFKQLSSVLQLSLTSYGNCWKFEESDMFCYQESDNQIYMAFILEDFDVQQSTNLQTIESIQNQQRSNYDNNLTNSNTDRNNNLNENYSEYPIHQNTYGTMQTSNAWSSELFNQTKSDCFGNKADLDNKISQSYKEASSYQLNGGFNYQSTTVQGKQYDRIDEMFSKIDQTLNNIKNQIKTPQNIINNNNAFPQKVHQQTHSQRTQSTNKYRQPERSHKPFSERRDQQPRNRNNYDSNQTSIASYETHQKYQAGYFSSYVQTPHQPLFSYESNKYSGQTFSKSNYNQDFSSSEVLALLRPQNRDNIFKIKEYFRNLHRGGQIPAGFDPRTSIIRAASNVQTRNYQKIGESHNNGIRPYSNLASENRYSSSHNQSFGTPHF